MISGANADGLLRFLTAGSVDDGKSTLIGRILYESGGLYEDQLASARRTNGPTIDNLDLSLITDGLRAEREQAITIDVAYRYFSTRKRKYIIADCPGHEQYTCNLVTGASTADAAIVLLDARKGVLEQTRRHTYIAWMLGIRCMIIAVNKMDLVDFDPNLFSKICSSFRSFASAMPGTESLFVPISALHGDNVVHRRNNMPWYGGPTVMELLEVIPAGESRETARLRFPVQSVIRPNQDFRGYAGQILCGTVKPGQEVLAFPSRQRTRVAEIMMHRESLQKASYPKSVVLSLQHHIDLSRGDMLVDPEDEPDTTRRVTANLIWMSPSPLRLRAPYLIKHTAQTLCASFVRLLDRLDIGTFQNVLASTLRQNEIGRVELVTHKPLFCEPYATNRALGCFIVIDPETNATVAGGTILEASPAVDETVLIPPSLNGAQADPQSRGLTVWFTGLSGAGKTTIANAVHMELLARGILSEILDGDVVRKHLSSDLGFSKKDRDENIRRIGFVAQLLTRNGVVVMVSAISPYRAIRDEIRHNIGNFLEVHVHAPLEVCEKRDPKGLYKKARAGEISGFTGIDDPYEPPLSPEIRCYTDQESVKSSGDAVFHAVLESLGRGGRRGPQSNG